MMVSKHQLTSCRRLPDHCFLQTFLTGITSLRLVATSMPRVRSILEHFKYRTTDELLSIHLLSNNKTNMMTLMGINGDERQKRAL